MNESQLTATVSATDIAGPRTEPLPSWHSILPQVGELEHAVLLDRSPCIVNLPARNDFNSSGGNVEVVAADFNRDGKLDLATTRADAHRNTRQIFTCLVLGKWFGNLIQVALILFGRLIPPLLHS